MSVAKTSAAFPEGPADALRVPNGLGVAGGRLWSSLLADYDFDEHELSILLQACRCADILDRLAEETSVSPLTVTNAKGDEVTNPVITEARMQAQAQARLIASLRLPSGEEDDTRPQRRGGARGSYGVRKTA